jgi:hypothetical protein
MPGMWRSLIVAAIAYGCGHPALDGYCPAALDAPLQAFYQQVNKAGQEGQKVLASANDARQLPHGLYGARRAATSRGGMKSL